jgi:Peptidase inhibitor family I36
MERQAEDQEIGSPKGSQIMRIAYLKMGAAACAMALAGAAFALSPSAHAESEAGQTTDGLSAAMIAQLKYNPSGKVIDSDQISYDHGDVIVTVGSNPDYTCPPNELCIYEFADYNGSHTAINHPLNKPFAAGGFLPQIGSLRNNRKNGSFLYTGKLHGRNSVCYPAGTPAPKLSNKVSRYKTLYLQYPGNC